MRFSKKTLGILGLLLFFPGVGFAQGAFQDQINAVRAAELRQQEADRVAQAAYEAEVAREAEKREKALAVQRAQRNAAASREQAYQEQLRDIELQRQRIDLQRAKARADRENDFLDQELRHKAAETEVVQSEADSNRNLSEGGKTLMEKTGEAKVKESSRWFDWW